MTSNPLAEVFGFAANDVSARAQRFRSQRLCPFQNGSPNCTKDKANDPLGVCSIIHAGRPAITCPTRFHEDWLIAELAAEFFFGKGASWTSLPEVRLKEANGKPAGNIDLVIVQYDDRGRILNYGSLEVQAVYISGNIRDPFRSYISLTNEGRATFDWSGKPKFPRADFLSSSRKRLVPQLLFKGTILHAWGRKHAVALDQPFFDTIPPLPEVPQSEADIAWLIFDLKRESTKSSFKLTHVKTVYTKFEESILRMSKPEIGAEADFLAILQSKIDEKLTGAAPITPLLGDDDEGL